MKVALQSMVWQFAYRGGKDGKPTLWTGGLSALEEAFEALGWADPYVLSEDEQNAACCNVDGCIGFIVAQGGMWRETGYWCLCHEHAEAYRNGEVQPIMKPWAVAKEAQRGSDGILR